jgi:hypothetical protein
MGYTIAVHTVDETAQQKLAQFLAKELRFPETLARDTQAGPGVGLGWNGRHATDEFLTLNGDQHPLAIGFDYASWISGCDRELVHNITRWMALQVGSNMAFEGLGQLPFWVYDGYEARPILLREQWTTKPLPADYVHETLCDELGMKPVPESPLYEALLGMQPRESNRIIKDEILRLQQAWLEFQPAAEME